VLPDALPRDARDAAPHLHVHGVPGPQESPAHEPDDDDRALRAWRGADRPRPELLPLDAPGREGLEQSMAREHPRMARPLSAAAREPPGRRPERLPRALRVQRARPHAGLLAAVGAPGARREGTALAWLRPGTAPAFTAGRSRPRRRPSS